MPATSTPTLEVPTQPADPTGPVVPTPSPEIPGDPTIAPGVADPVGPEIDDPVPPDEAPDPVEVPPATPEPDPA